MIRRRLTLYRKTPVSDDHEEEAFWKTLWEKGENAGYQHFLLFLQCFPRGSLITILATFHVSSALNLERAKIFSFGKELTLYRTIC